MTQVAPFDDTTLAPGAALDLRAAADRIRTRLRRSTEDIIEIGRDLAAGKRTLGHGHFLPWIEAEFGMSERTARNFMQVHERFGKALNRSKSETVADLEISQKALYLLASPSTEPEVVDAAMEKAEAGDKVGKAEVEEIKDWLKAERKKASELRADKAALQGQNARLHAAEEELRERVLLLGYEIERAQRAQGAPVQIEVNKYRAALRLVWDLAPAEDRAWFLAEAARQDETLPPPHIALGKS